LDELRVLRDGAAQHNQPFESDAIRRTPPAHAQACIRFEQGKTDVSPESLQTLKHIRQLISFDAKPAEVVALYLSFQYELSFSDSTAENSRRFSDSLTLATLRQQALIQAILENMPLRSPLAVSSQLSSGDPEFLKNMRCPVFVRVDLTRAASSKLCNSSIPCNLICTAESCTPAQ
jgi:hypothetical protein